MLYSITFTCLHPDFASAEEPSEPFKADFSSFTEALDFANQLATQIEQGYPGYPKIQGCLMESNGHEYDLHKSVKTGKFEPRFPCTFRNAYKRDLNILENKVFKEPDIVYEEAIINDPNDPSDWVLCDGLKELFESLPDDTKERIKKKMKERIEKALKTLMDEGFEIVDTGKGYKVIFPEEEQQESIKRK